MKIERNQSSALNVLSDKMFTDKAFSDNFRYTTNQDNILYGKIIPYCDSQGNNQFSAKYSGADIYSESCGNIIASTLANKVANNNYIKVLKIGAIVVVATIVVATIYKNWDSITNWFGSFWNNKDDIDDQTYIPDSSIIDQVE